MLCVKRYALGRLPCSRGFLARLGGAGPRSCAWTRQPGSRPAVPSADALSGLWAFRPVFPGPAFLHAGPSLCFRSVRTSLLQGVSLLSCAWSASLLLIPVQLLARSGVCHVSFAVHSPGGRSAPRRESACVFSCSAVSLGASSGLHIGGSSDCPSSKRPVTDSAVQLPGPRRVSLLYTWTADPSRLGTGLPQSGPRRTSDLGLRRPGAGLRQAQGLSVHGLPSPGPGEPGPSYATFRKTASTPDGAAPTRAPHLQGREGHVRCRLPATGLVKKPPRLLIMPAHEAALTCCGRRHGHPLGSVLPREGPGPQSAWLRFGGPPSGRTGRLVAEARAPLTPGALHSGPVRRCLQGRVLPGSRARDAPRVACATENSACVRSRHVGSRGSLSLGNSRRQKATDGELLRCPQVSAISSLSSHWL